MSEYFRDGGFTLFQAVISRTLAEKKLAEEKAAAKAAAQAAEKKLAEKKAAAKAAARVAAERGLLPARSLLVELAAGRKRIAAAKNEEKLSEFRNTLRRAGKLASLHRNFHVACIDSWVVEMIQTGGIDDFASGDFGVFGNPHSAATWALREDSADTAMALVAATWDNGFASEFLAHAARAGAVKVITALLAEGTADPNANRGRALNWAAAPLRKRAWSRDPGLPARRLEAVEILLADPWTDPLDCDGAALYHLLHWKHQFGGPERKIFEAKAAALVDQMLLSPRLEPTPQAMGRAVVHLSLAGYAAFLAGPVAAAASDEAWAGAVKSAITHSRYHAIPGITLLFRDPRVANPAAIEAAETAVKFSRSPGLVQLAKTPLGAALSPNAWGMGLVRAAHDIAKVNDGPYYWSGSSGRWHLDHLRLLLTKCLPALPHEVLSRPCGNELAKFHESAESETEFGTLAAMVVLAAKGKHFLSDAFSLLMSRGVCRDFDALVRSARFSRPPRPRDVWLLLSEPKVFARLPPDAAAVVDGITSAPESRITSSPGAVRVDNEAKLYKILRQLNAGLGGPRS